MAETSLLSFVAVLEPEGFSREALDIALDGLASRTAAAGRNAEFILVGNGLASAAIDGVRSLSAARPEVQFYALAQRSSYTNALLAGLSNAIGEAVITLDPFDWDIVALDRMLERAGTVDAAIVATRRPARSVLPQRSLGPKNATEQRLLSRPVVDAILEHEDGAEMLIGIAADPRFAIETIWSDRRCGLRPPRFLPRLSAKILKLLRADGTRPLRLVSLLGVFGGLLNVAYMGLAVAEAMRDAPAAQIRLELQLAGTAFLLFFMLALMAEFLMSGHGRPARRPEFRFIESSAAQERRKEPERDEEDE